MDAIVFEWGGALLRWLHIIAAMAWIGSSFFFMHLDATLRSHPSLPAGKGGVGWQVHGGGFYEMKKYMVAPETLPAELTWHKWQSYATWLSGFFLLGWVYYAQADLFLIDPARLSLSPPLAGLIGIATLVVGWIVYDLLSKSEKFEEPLILAVFGLLFVMGTAFLYALLFSSRGALLHTGALLATMMSGNVFRIIIPNQRKVIADLVAGREPDPALGKQAKQRSIHNNYLTLPVVLLMISNHYPMMHLSPVSLALFVGLITVAGALVRHFFNGWHRDHDKAPWWCWGGAAAAIAAAVALTWFAAPGRLTELEGRRLAASMAPAALAEEASLILSTRCSMCHAKEPLWPGLAVAPKGVLLDSEAEMARQAAAVRLHAVLTRAMPPGNITEMTEEERVKLAAWIAAPRGRP